MLGSIAFGMFALSPYLALRRYAPGPGITRGDGFINKFLESRIVAGFLLGGALGLAAFGATANGGDVGASLAEFKALFDSQLFVHVTTLDFCSLWLLFYGPLVEDMRRRGMDTSAAPLFAADFCSRPHAYLRKTNPNSNLSPRLQFHYAAHED